MDKLYPLRMGPSHDSCLSCQQHRKKTRAMCPILHVISSLDGIGDQILLKRVDQQRFVHCLAGATLVAAHSLNNSLGVVEPVHAKYHFFLEIKRLGRDSGIFLKPIVWNADGQCSHHTGLVAIFNDHLFAVNAGAKNVKTTLDKVTGISVCVKSDQVAAQQSEQNFICPRVQTENVPRRKWYVQKKGQLTCNVRLVQQISQHHWHHHQLIVLYPNKVAFFIQIIELFDRFKR
ncbi:hypothetical protein BpHYR1_044414 [Brachionus plicatilis]|uniref:Uncharacterized protein n=1 Tax=Brachionus plicatilis TaxID=10195 RepID=A0A3M7RGK2_BRAPC|nr:hypothetical protein BpHYR1_044414 [Brachionus plicatilis]